MNNSINYDKKHFLSVANSSNGEVSEQTVFEYHQLNDIVWAEYSGGGIEKGFLIGKVDAESKLEFSYQHINSNMEIRIGFCISYPEITQDGRIRLYESWRWLNGDCSRGESIIEQVI